MDCNKEEAIRAKGIAEKKMQNNDFLGARKICMKAQQLYSDLENISQMLMVCDVHCSAEQKLLGNEMDWYGILQIDQKADELTIKKQYRKFALQLHPDKNKFSGAEAAFKLIGEAQMILLDRDKRNSHDQKRNASVSKTAVPYRPSQNSSWKSYAGVQNNFRGNFSGINLQQQQPTQPGNALSTFWTSCPYCKIKYQYYRAHMHKSLKCQNCKKPFIAYETNMQAPTTNSNQAYAAYAQKKENASAGNPKDESFQQKGQKGGCSSGIGSTKVNRKREKKPVLESSESSASESSSDSEEDMVNDKDAVHQGLYGEQRRRSSRSKQQVSYNEKVSDDDEIPAPKRGKRSGSSCATKEQNGDASKGVESKMNSQSEPATNAKGDEEKEEQKENACFLKSLKVGAKESGNVYNDKESLGTNKGVHENPPSDTNSHDPAHSFPKSDFNDFAEIRKQECFKVGQHWAIYDTQNGMPRFYAKIKRLYSPGFKLQITWLEARPDDSDGKKWASADLPISCGKFTIGQSEIIYSTAMFSHLICFEKARNGYNIYPRRGETWAIFKNWNINWCSDPDSKREYEYEYVEILSEYVEGVGIRVALLQKVEGFVSVFCQMVQDSSGKFEVPGGEYLRFSHRVPSYKLNGHEGALPSGSVVELDPASMLFSVGARDKTACDVDHDNEVVQFDVPDPEFYNFDAARSPEMFQSGQIWALYSDEDGLPKYYGQIKKIYSSQSKWKIVISWLECSSLPDNVIKWHDEGMPISCGTFMVTKSTQNYDCTMSFSHLVKAPMFSKTNVDVLPSRGDIWALYKDWSPDISTSGLGTCEYDIVEVSEDNGLERKVLVLVRVDGFNSVFKVKMNGGLAETMTIHQHELFRFSHSIPCFPLTEEKGGSLRGCWELDPAALPVRFFSQS